MPSTGSRKRSAWRALVGCFTSESDAALAGAVETKPSSPATIEQQSSFCSSSVIDVATPHKAISYTCDEAANRRFSARTSVSLDQGPATPGATQYGLQSPHNSALGSADDIQVHPIKFAEAFSDMATISSSAGHPCISSFDFEAAMTILPGDDAEITSAQDALLPMLSCDSAEHSGGFARPQLDETAPTATASTAAGQPYSLNTLATEEEFPAHGAETAVHELADTASSCSPQAARMHPLFAQFAESTLSLDSNSRPSHSRGSSVSFPAGFSLLQYPIPEDYVTGTETSQHAMPSHHVPTSRLHHSATQDLALRHTSSLPSTTTAHRTAYHRSSTHASTLHCRPRYSAGDASTAAGHILIPGSSSSRYGIYSGLVAERAAKRVAEHPAFAHPAIQTQHSQPDPLALRHVLSDIALPATPQPSFHQPSLSPSPSSCVPSSACSTSALGQQLRKKAVQFIQEQREQQREAAAAAAALGQEQQQVKQPVKPETGMCKSVSFQSSLCGPHPFATGPAQSVLHAQLDATTRRLSAREPAQSALHLKIDCSGSNAFAQSALRTQLDCSATEAEELDDEEEERARKESMLLYLHTLSRSNTSFYSRRSSLPRNSDSGGSFCMSPAKRYPPAATPTLLTVSSRRSILGDDGPSVETESTRYRRLPKRVSSLLLNGGEQSRRGLMRHHTTAFE